MNVYRLLLHLYPAGFRERFGADLEDLFRDKYRAAAARGGAAVAVFWVRIIRDAVITAIAERFTPSQVFPERGPLMEGLFQDIRFAARMIVRRPALSIVIILTLALGIGANTAIFSLVNTVLLASTPYREPDRLVNIREQQPERSPRGRPVRPANFFEWKDRATSFEDVAWTRDWIPTLTGDGGEPATIIAYRFSHNLLPLLGVQPALGRGFTMQDDTPGSPRVVLLSDKLWHRRYAADPGVLGRTVMLDGEPHTVVGVMGPEFTYEQRTELWVPIALTPQQRENRVNGFLRLVGRLKPGVSEEQAQRELASLYEDLARRYPGTNRGMTAIFTPFSTTGDARPLLLTLLGAVTFVLLIACANVANLLLADATGRRRELAVRSAVGATRYRVMRQMLTESMVLALAGGALGMLVTWWLRDALLVLFPANIMNLDLPLVERIDMGTPVFLFALLVSGATGLVFGALPAWPITRGDLQGALKEGDRGGSSSRRTHAVLIVGEVALSIVLLAGALLMVQSFIRVQRAEFGFDTDRVLTARLILPQHRYADPAKREAFSRELLQRLRAIPGVEAAGLAYFPPLSGWSAGLPFELEGRPAAVAAERPTAEYNVASDDYFRATGVRLLAGRTFLERDNASAPPVVIVNETFAQRYWPGEPAVGKRVILTGAAGPTAYEIVGVIADMRSQGLEQPVEPGMFFSMWQGTPSTLGIAIRTPLDPASLAPQMRTAVWSIDSEQPVSYVLTLSELAAESIAFRRAGMTLAAGFGVLALVLAAIGLFGVLSYSVSRRTREIGVRVALGATRGEVAKLVVREGLLMTSAGLAIGIVAALVLTRYLTALLFEVEAADPLTHAAVAGMLLGVALLATLVPARRATAVDPLVALRAE